MPGKTILSDMRGAYTGIIDLEGFNFKHFTVNHTKNFVDPERAHTQKSPSGIALKQRSELHSGTERSMIADTLEVIISLKS